MKPSVTSSIRSPWLVAFVVLALAQLLLVATHVRLIPSILAWTLAPLLAIWVWRARGPRLLILALGLCWVSDVTGNPSLIGLGPSALYLGVAAFALADVVLIVFFLRSAPRLWGRSWFGLIYLVAAALGLALAWGRLGGALRLVALLYLVLLVVTATSALLHNFWTGVGAALVFVSQLLVVLEVSGLIAGSATWYRLLVLRLHPFGLALIAVGAVLRTARIRVDASSNEGESPP